MAGNETPSLAKVLKDAIEGRLADLHTAMPATIEKYDAATHMASVSPCLQRKYANDELVDLPVIQNVPICFPRGGGAAVTFDLQVGDPVLLIFSERSIDTWKNRGGKVDPKDPRKHALSDAYAIPGGYPKAMPPSKALVTAAFSRDGSFKIENLNGFTELAADGSFSLETPGMRVKYGTDGKTEIYSTAAGVDFITQLLLALDKAIETTKVATSIGLQPFIPDPAYLLERAKLDAFKP